MEAICGVVDNFLVVVVAADVNVKGGDGALLCSSFGMLNAE